MFIQKHLDFMIAKGFDNSGSQSLYCEFFNFLTQLLYRSAAIMNCIKMRQIFADLREGVSLKIA